MALCLLMVPPLPVPEKADADAHAQAATHGLAPRLPHALPTPCRAADRGAGDAAPDIDGAVLVVEDDATLAAVMAEALHCDGHRVAIAENGADALRLARRGRPACILLDLHLPVLDGEAFLAAYRGLEAEEGAGRAGEPDGVPPTKAHRLAPVIIVTALSGGEAAGAAERLGTAGFLTKPYDLDALSTLVGRFASRSLA